METASENSSDEAPERDTTLAGHLQKLRETPEHTFPPVLRRSQPCPHLDPRLLLQAEGQ